MAVDDSFSIRIKRYNGWAWSKNCIGNRLECDYYRARSIVNDIKHNHRIVVIFNNSQNHVSEIHFGGVHEILHNEIFDFVR